MSKVEVIALNQLTPVECPCGQARRALLDQPLVPFSLHLTTISADAKAHFHRETTEVYVVLECQQGAALHVDQQVIPLQPLTAVVLPPGCVHRLVGQAEVLIIAQPKFDPADEFLPGE